MKILVTGAAGFIGFHLINHLLERGDDIIGLDNINDYYDPQLKLDRLEAAGIEKVAIHYGHPVRSQLFPSYKFYKTDLVDQEQTAAIFAAEQPEVVVNLAAQAGVRYSLTNPSAYIQSNVVGFANILECCRQYQVQHLVYASSSSVYGLNKKVPFSTGDNVDHPVSLYAATKKSNELMAHTYSHLYKIPTTGLRFFTVYGPWGRPDMAYHLFSNAILRDQPIKVFNFGRMQRDFTYIDDIVEGLTRVIDHPPTGNEAWDATDPDPASSLAPFKIYNIGNQHPVALMDFIEILESELGKKAKKDLMPMQPGDVEITYADVGDLVKDLGYRPNTSLEEGIKSFVLWYKQYYGVEAIK